MNQVLCCSWPIRNPGDVLGIGASVVSGLALDRASRQGSGVDRIDLFLDSREAGGVLLGSVLPQQTTEGSTRAFQVTILLARNASGAHDLVAHAHSTLTGSEASMSVPVFVGIPPPPLHYGRGRTWTSATRSLRVA